MLMVGISVGVAFNMIFADWMITVLLIILFIVNSTKSFTKGIETWGKETFAKQIWIDRKLASNRNLMTNKLVLFKVLWNFP